MAHRCAGGAQHRHSAQLLFHHPLKVGPKMAIESQNVYLALMISDDDIGLVRIKFIAPLDLDGDHHHEAVNFRPDRA